MPVPTPQSVKDEISALLDADWLGYLYGRWQDEKEYEDIKDYGEAFTKRTGYPIIRMLKRPMTFVFSHPKVPDSVYELKVTARQTSWRRVA
jgi:hypothetical protein